MKMVDEKYSVGIDFGTDSVRALIVNVETGNEVGTFVADYTRWAAGLFCDKAADQYRQHPLDYTEGIVVAVKGAIAKAVAETNDSDLADKIVGMGIDTTGSTPVAVDQDGTPLSMLEEFANDPNAMFILWKDHTGVGEAELINTASQRTESGRFTQYCGGTYSSEWFWSKILHTMKTADTRLTDAAYSWVEHCDWMAAELAGDTNPLTLKRSRCAAAHKALWHESWNLPFDFLESVDTSLSILRGRLYTDTYTSDTLAGSLSGKWAERLGLKEGTLIAVGAFDAHLGAVGSGIKSGILSRIVGTSTCDMVVAPYDQMIEGGQEKLIKGICGQADGSIVPGMFGLEAGQSAVGDIFANFRDMLANTMLDVLETGEHGLNRKALNDAIYKVLTQGAENLSPDQVPLVIDYHNGRRTPNADQRLTGAAFGLTLDTNAAKYFAGLVQGTCYTARQIMETFIVQGVSISGVKACGGIADKSPYVMQVMSDVMGVEIDVAASGQTCALGAAIAGATVGKAYGPDTTFQMAQEKMACGSKAHYSPNPAVGDIHDGRYALFGKAVQQNEGLLRELK